ncbi:hypothetical protein [Succinivibrio dextrinosolvens]|uniref:hypothetical protein n=1 Tax=Succinivibrio dextrinosolvens TaxID=83771 RepID=UPI00241D9A75|nr:hypothetical protein [Succinivibrio dextrinosolvens]MBE6422448.1 hypothetical protein [Succinivibrio dextrinosolvens]
MQEIIESEPNQKTCIEIEDEELYLLMNDHDEKVNFLAKKFVEMIFSTPAVKKMLDIKGLQLRQNYIQETAQTLAREFSCSPNFVMNYFDDVRI